MSAYIRAWKWDTNRASRLEHDHHLVTVEHDRSRPASSTASSGPGAISANPSGSTLLGGHSLTVSNMCSIVCQAWDRI